MSKEQLSIHYLLQYLPNSGAEFIGATIVGNYKIEVGRFGLFSDELISLIAELICFDPESSTNFIHLAKELVSKTGISRSQCTIIGKDGEIYLHVGETSNPVQVNGKKIEPNTQVKIVSGSVVKFGRVFYKVLLDQKRILLSYESIDFDPLAEELIVPPGKVTIGRSFFMRNNLDEESLTGSFVSKAHCQIITKGELEKKTFALLSFSENTWVDGEKIMPSFSTELYDGVEIALGKLRFVFRVLEHACKLVPNRGDKKVK